VRREEVEKEVELMRITHPNVLGVLGVIYTKENHISIVSELCEADLDSVLRKRRDSLFVRIEWGLQAARGLCWLHGQNLLHRDVKPMNMLLAKEHNVVR
jgi:serine/threonine protein kinase